MKKRTSLLILLIAFSHCCLFCIKGKKANRLTKGQRRNPIDAQIWVANFLNNPHNFFGARQRLEKAIEDSNIELATFLLSSYASRLANARHTHGALSSLTLAHHAMFRDKPVMLSLLLKAGAKPEDYKKESLLFDAVSTVRAECVQRLLEDGYANPNVITISQNPRSVHGTPLHCNSYNLGVPVQTLTTAKTFADKIKIAQALLDHGAYVATKDGLGRTVIDVLDLQEERDSANQLKKLLLPYIKQKIA
ncbi:hypothetical protein BH09DEP1_BH09DEP1_0010 [soil metagenome]